MSDDEPAETKLTRTKRRWAAEGRFLAGRATLPGSERLPPGQHLVRDWPVLDLGTEPAVALPAWRLDVTGAVERPASLDWAAFGRLPQGTRRSDIHCVTSWSRYDNDWQGVATRDLLEHVMPTDAAAALLLTCHDGYTTNLRIEDFAAPDAILATHWQGAPLTREHGGPMRLVVPHSTSGKVRNGCARSSSAPRTARASGRRTAIISAAIPGGRSGTQAIEGEWTGWRISRRCGHT